MLSRHLNSHHIRSLYHNTSKRLKRSIYPSLLMTTSKQQQPPVSSVDDHVNDSENMIQQVPPLPVSSKWNHQFTTTRTFFSTVPNKGKCTVQMIPATKIKYYPLHNKRAISEADAAAAEAIIRKETAVLAAAVATTMATAMVTTVQTAQSSQSTTQIIHKATAQAAPSLVYQPSPLHHKASIQPTLEEYIDKLPLIKLPSHYTVITTKSKEEADKELAGMISQETVFGVDMEWKPSFRKNVPPSPTGLIQICGATKVLLIQVSQMKELPEVLIKFLTDRTIYKTGVNIRGDGVKLHNDFKVSMNGLLDLRPIATEALEKLPVGARYKSKTLRSLTGIFMGKKMPKGSTRMSNWNAPLLRPIQVEYAANDAYASYALYHIMMDTSKLTKSSLHPHHLSWEAI